MYRHFFKRFTDIIISLLGIVIGGIPMLIVALLVKLDSPGPVLFKQAFGQERQAVSHL